MKGKKRTWGRLTDEQRAMAAQWIPLAHKLAWKHARGDLDRKDELLSYAHEAVLHAAAKFDPSKGVRMMTYVYATIDGYLRRARRDMKARTLQTASADVPGLERVAPAQAEHVDQTQMPEWWGRLDSREQDVARMLAEGLTYDEIGVAFSVCRERVRQIRMEIAGKIAGHVPLTYVNREVRGRRALDREAMMEAIRKALGYRDRVLLVDLFSDNSVRTTAVMMLRSDPEFELVSVKIPGRKGKPPLAVQYRQAAEAA